MAKHRDLNPAIIIEVKESLEAGLTPREAADHSMLSYRTFRHWYKTGRAKFSGDRATSAPDLFVEFYQTVHKAKATGKRVLLQRVRNASQKDWKAAAYLLDRLERVGQKLGTGAGIGGDAAVTQQRAIDAARKLLADETETVSV